MNFLIDEQHCLILKAAMPYLPAQNRRVISMMVRTQELIQVMQKMDEEEAELLSAASVGGDPVSGFLDAMRDFCSEHEMDSIEFFCNLWQALRLFREYTGSNGGGFSREAMSPEQQNLFETLLGG